MTYWPRTRRSPRRDNILAQLGPGALAQLRAQGIDVDRHVQPKKRGRYQRAPKEERTVDGIVFDSKLEANFYVVLKEKQGGFSFKTQVPFELQAAFTDGEGKKHRAIHYVADFVVMLPDGEHVIDSKGHMTDVFLLKRKLFIDRHRRPLHTLKTLGELRAFLARHGVV